MNAQRMKTFHNLAIARAGIANEITRLGRLCRESPERGKLLKLLGKIDALRSVLDGEISWRKACRAACLSFRDELLISEAISEHYLTSFAFGWDKNNPELAR